MTPLERIEAALTFKEGDRVPASTFPFGISRRVLGCDYKTWSLDGEVAAKSHLQYQKLIGEDFFNIGMDASQEAHGFGLNVIFPDHGVPYPNPKEKFIKTPDDYFKLEPYDPAKAMRTRQLIKMTDILANEKGHEIPVWGTMCGPMEVLSQLRGTSSFMKDCFKNQEAVHHALRIINDVLLELARKMMEVGAHAIIPATAFGSQSLMSEKLYQEIEIPYLKEWDKVVHEKGVYLGLHNCGTGPYMKCQLDACNADILQIGHVPTDCKDWQEVKKKYDNVSILGYLDPINLSELHTPEQIMEECREEINNLAKGGGFILCPTCEFPPDAPLLNAKAIVDAATKYGRYQ